MSNLFKHPLRANRASIATESLLTESTWGRRTKAGCVASLLHARRRLYQSLGDAADTSSIGLLRREWGVRWGSGRKYWAVCHCPPLPLGGLPDGGDTNVWQGAVRARFRLSGQHTKTDSLECGFCAHMPLRDAATTGSGRRALRRLSRPARGERYRKSGEYPWPSGRHRANHSRLPLLAVWCHRTPHRRET